MTRPRIETVDLREPGELALASARLIITQVFPALNYRTPEKYLVEKNPDLYTMYTLTQNRSDALATALVVHGDSGEDTYIPALAVDPSVRGKNYGRDMMEYVAEQALVYENPRLSLLALQGSFFERLGFSYTSGMEMAATPDTVLDS